MITNRQLKQASQQLFTYSAQYQAPFYGREKSIVEMEKKASGLKNGETLFISQPLGTGKTFLVTHLISTKKLDVPLGASFLTARGIAERPEVMDNFPGDVLVVDEADIKTTYQKLLRGLDKLQEYLLKNNKRAIVIGDFCLRDAELEKHLGKSARIEEFEPIDQDFLCGVLDSRFRYFLGDSLKPEFQINDVIAPDLLRAFTGEWLVQVNNFRGIFSLLQSVIGNDRFVRFNDNPARLELSTVTDFLADQQDELDEEEQENFLQALRDFIREKYPMGSGLTRGFMIDELYSLAEESEIDVDYEDFSEEILYPLAAAGYLLSTGIPYCHNGEFIRRPAPFVPSLKLLLSAT